MLNSTECMIMDEYKSTGHWMQEKGWHSYINKILHPIGDRTQSRPRTAGLGIAIIEATDVEFYNPSIYSPEVVSYYESLQGNGVESRV